MSQVQGERQDTSVDGRIQLNGDAAPELEVLLELDHDYVVLGHSSGELGRWEKDTVKVAPIGRGWFTHDDDDELLSCVYYVSVPEDSGKLIIYDGNEMIEIDSQTGNFVFFKPDVRHEVSRNNSYEHRLSIGMNFGVPETYPADSED